MDVINLRFEKKLDSIYKVLPKLSSGLPLQTLAINELNFLRVIDGKRYFYEDAFVARAVMRYEKYWLPLISSLSETFAGDLKYAPPLDVHWVWHVHMLAPVAYQSDCKAVCGRMIAHQLVSLERLEILRQATRVHWEKAYPNVPFDVGKIEDKENCVDGACAKSGEFNFDSRIRYDIRSAASRQGVFFYQVSLAHYRDSGFLIEAVDRYAMYLYLKKLNKETFLVPCYDIDVIWHTHQVHPVEYARDTNDILGFTLKHDDSVNDRAEGSKLNNADEVTRKLWYDTFKVTFARPGSMFRGNPPQGKLFPLTAEYQRSLLAPKEMDVELNSVKMSSMPDLQENNAVFTVELETESANGLQKKKSIALYSSECNIARQEKNSLTIENPDGLVHFAVTHKNCPKLHIKLDKV